MKITDTEYKDELFSKREIITLKKAKQIVMYTDGNIFRVRGLANQDLPYLDVESVRWYVDKNGLNRLEKGVEIDVYYRKFYIIEPGEQFDLTEDGIIICKGCVIKF